MAYTTIDLPTDYFNTVLYTGTNATQSITGVGFQPDFIWFKNRTGANFNALFNAVMGRAIGLTSNGTDVDATSLAGRDLASFDSNGFTVGQTENWGSTNLSGASIVSWNWKANGAGVSNTAGTITSTVSANTTAGFSIVSYTGNNTAGATVGHGLSSTPQLIIIKNRDSAVNWNSYHEPLGNQAYLRLNTTGASSTGASIWNNTSPTSSVFTLGSGFDAVNESSSNHIAYCFAEVKGYSKFGSYTGNGNSDGPFIYTGFRPAFFLMKRTDSTGDWQLEDKSRLGYNPNNNLLFPNVSDAESSVADTDILSNGFKLRTTGTGRNASGGTYIYMAFAENPFVTSGGIPVTAR
jgi:hypothetical protein